MTSSEQNSTGVLGGTFLKKFRSFLDRIADGQGITRNSHVLPKQKREIQSRLESGDEPNSAKLFVRQKPLHIFPCLLYYIAVYENILLPSVYIYHHFTLSLLILGPESTDFVLHDAKIPARTSAILRRLRHVLFLAPIRLHGVLLEPIAHDWACVCMPRKFCFYFFSLLNLIGDNKYAASLAQNDRGRDSLLGLFFTILFALYSPRRENLEKLIAL